MIHCGPNKLHANICSPTGMTSNATVAGVTCDVKGHNYLLCGTMTDSQASTADFLTTFHLEECDTTVASSFATISGWVEGTDYTQATALRDSATLNTYMIGIPWVGRMRYARVVFQAAATTQVMASWFHLFRSDEMPNTDAEMNCEKTYFG